jgi:hypothetical protein
MTFSRAHDVAHATKLLDLLSYGTVADSWRSQSGTPVYGPPHSGGSTDLVNAEATPASTAVIRKLLDAATS